MAFTFAWCHSVDGHDIEKDHKDAKHINERSVNMTPRHYLETRKGCNSMADLSTCRENKYYDHTQAEQTTTEVKIFVRFALVSYSRFKFVYS